MADGLALIVSARIQRSPYHWMQRNPRPWMKLERAAKNPSHTDGPTSVPSSKLKWKAYRVISVCLFWAAAPTD